jgi:2-oxoglutarate dehydrogenase E2 component (dihydrolipoamide succinyltransferase)
MITDLKVPSPGESINQVLIASWLAKDGDIVSRDQEIVEIDSDKATMAITAPEGGKLSIVVGEGETVDVGSIIARIDASFAAESPAKPSSTPKEIKPKEAEKAVEKRVVAKEEKPSDALNIDFHVSPLARKLLAENNVSAEEVAVFYKNLRIGREDVEFFLEKRGVLADPQPEKLAHKEINRNQERQKMTPLRQKLSERLVAVKNQTAMLTTFNEVNMTPVMQIRNQYKDVFKEKHGTSLGFMSFFTKAVTEALKLFPQVNAMIDGDEIVFNRFADVGIAVSTPKGLMVPVLRNAEAMSLAQIELKIKELATKARDRKISPDELSGGTFTITNGGVFGSLLSTPILNPPQSAILGMHNIVERPIAVNGKVEIHPMMYVALSYDHRIIDGRESVGFLVKVKEMLENPARMLHSGNDPAIDLLGLR